MKHKSIRICTVLPGSIGDEAGIEPGDSLISINGEKITDIFDYRFLITEESLLLEILKRDGEVWELEIEKDEYEDLGLEFGNSMMDEAASCTNKCIFCFIDQLPEGMRKTLYFKDDDSRLSFLTGNYVTLTNMKDRDIERIIRYRLSPINISVHTTNPDLRVFMLKNRFAGNILDRIKTLVNARITVNCQIVLCREINDGGELDKTVSQLAELYPGVKSISVVPVGITRYREGLCSLKPYDGEASKVVVKQVENWQMRLLERFASRVVYLADEFYLMAGIKIPDYEHYEDFPQIENGVGLVALLRHEFYEYLDEIKVEASIQTGSRTVSIATGVSAQSVVQELVNALKKRFAYINVNVFEIKNGFFGENVTVTGLLTGRDIVSQLESKDLGTELLICRAMLKAGEELFLDDYTVEMVKEQLGVKVTVVENSGKDLIDKILGRGGSIG